MTLSRRNFCTAVGAVLAVGTGRFAWADQESSAYKIVAETDRRRILESAEKYLPIEAGTFTPFRFPKSPGGRTTFFRQPAIFGPTRRNQIGPTTTRTAKAN